MAIRATTVEQRVHSLTDRLAVELTVLWRNERVNVLAMPDEALRRLMADYLLGREAYLASRPDIAYAIAAQDEARTRDD